MATADAHFWEWEPDHVMRAVAAFSARCTELYVHLHRVEGRQREWRQIRTQQVDRLLQELAPVQARQPGRRGPQAGPGDPSMTTTTTSMEVEAASEVSADALGFPVWNQTDLPDERLVATSEVREIARTLSTCVNNARSAGTKGSMFDRGSYTPPENPFDEMRAARTALALDDIVAGVAEITEAFTFQGLTWEASDPDDADVFNQIARDLDRFLTSTTRRRMGANTRSWPGSSRYRGERNVEGVTATGGGPIQPVPSGACPSREGRPGGTDVVRRSAVK